MEWKPQRDFDHWRTGVKYQSCFLVRGLKNSTKACLILFPHQVVALSADCQESTKMLCLSAGMNLFFSKPLKKSELG